MTSPHNHSASEASVPAGRGGGVGREKPMRVQGLPVYLRREKLLLVTHASGVSRR